MRQFLRILLIISGIVIVSCTSIDQTTPSPTLTGLLTEREAIDAAIRLATSNQPEINVTQVNPTNIMTKQSTLDKAFQEILSTSTIPPKYSPTTPVWIIIMEGQWKEGFPFPTGVSTPGSYDHFYVILDAKSGSTISLGTFRNSITSIPTTAYLTIQTETPFPAQQLRITNQGSLLIHNLVVRFPDDQISFGDIPFGGTTDYQLAPHGVYRYAAYNVEVNGKLYEQPVVDWIGENPMEGEFFTYTLELDPSRWGAEGQVINLIGVTKDQRINDTPGMITPTAETELPTRSTPTAIPPTADKDLTQLLIENNVYPQFGKPGLHLVDDHQLLVWFDTAALVDLRSDTLLSTTRVTTGPVDQKVDFTKIGVGVFKKDPMCLEGSLDTTLGKLFPKNINCMDHPIILDRYDTKLVLIETLDLSKVFDLRFDVLRPIQCALSQSGEKIACAKNETSQILLYDLQTKAQNLVYDFSWTDNASFRGVRSMTFAGNDQYLAFTAEDADGYDFGLVDLEHNRLVDYTKWNAIAEDIQTTENAVYFHEQLNGLQFPRSGKMFKIDLDTLEKQETQFADQEESSYVTVSPTGKYIATVMDTAAPGAAFPKGSIKIYDGKTMALIRQIDLEHGFPSLVIDEANRFLISYYFVDKDIKLFRYGF